MRKILISKCSKCPFRDHGGGFGKILYIPICRKNHHEKLPYTEHASNGRVTAVGTDVIPEWCPLEKEEC